MKRLSNLFKFTQLVLTELGSDSAVVFFTMPYRIFLCGVCIFNEIVVIILFGGKKEGGISNDI